MIIDPDLLKLCYIDRERFAWFTSCALPLQWGDDWDDAPYEHNAGDPYDFHREGEHRTNHVLIKVAWDSRHEVPCADLLNSPYSVRDINCGVVPWLRVPTWNSDERYIDANIPAGATLRQFVKIMEQTGGEVYLPRSAHIYV